MNSITAYKFAVAELTLWYGVFIGVYSPYDTVFSRILMMLLFQLGLQTTAILNNQSLIVMILITTFAHYNALPFIKFLRVG